MKPLEGAVLEDYLNSVETDGKPTDHVRRCAAELARKPYNAKLTKAQMLRGGAAWKRFYYFIAYRGNPRA